MLSTRSHLAAVSVDGLIYAIGGRLGAAVEVYDPKENRWATRRNLPTLCYSVAGAAINGAIYALCDSTDGSAPSTLRYNPTTDQWTGVRTMPTERIGYAVGALNGLLYVVGGYPLSGSYEPLGMAEVYDPTSDTWSKRHSLTVPRKYAALVASQGRLYVVGGATESPSANTPIAAVEEYDPLTDMWATKAPMPTPRKLLGAAEWDGRLYAIGGQTPSDTTSSVAEFDLQSNAWSERQSLAKERYALATVAFDGSLYVVGGLDSLSRPLRDVEAGTIIGSRIYIPYITLE